MIVIHCVLAFAMMLILTDLFVTFQAEIRADAIAIFTPVAVIAIAASTRTIGRALAHQRKFADDPTSA